MPVEIRGYTGGVAVHSHFYHQLIVPVDGALRVTMGATTGTTTDRVGVFIPKGCRHRFRATDRGRLAVLDIDPDDFTPDTTPTDRLFDERFFAVPGALHHLAHYMAHRQADKGSDQDAQLYRLFLDALPAVACNDGVSSVVSRARALIAANLSEPITVEGLAETLDLTRGALVRAFRAELGLSPARYVEEARMALAVRLLNHETTPLCEIAHATGFSEQSAFTRAFKRRFGTTPGARRRHVYCIK